MSKLKTHDPLSGDAPSSSASVANLLPKAKGKSKARASSSVASAALDSPEAVSQSAFDDLDRFTLSCARPSE